MILLRILVALAFGLVFGSFLTVAVHRIPRRESVVAPRSRCPACGTQLLVVDNIPLVSYVLLRGRCRTCRARISPVYPLLELATSGLFVVAALRFERVLPAAMLGPFLGLMLAVALIDARHRIVPNRLVYPSLAIYAVLIAVGGLAGWGVDGARAGIGFLAYGGGLLVVALISPRGMGMGDVKLAALIGLVLGSLGLAYVAVAAGLGILFGGLGALVALVGGASRKQAIPFGPFLVAGAAVSLFLAPQIADAYLRTVT